MLRRLIRSLVRHRGVDHALAQAFKSWKRDPRGAEIAFRRALAAGRDGAEVYHGLGATLVRQGKLDEGVQALELAVERGPENAGYHLALALALSSANQQPLEVIAHLREAMRRLPEVVEIEAYLFSSLRTVCDWDAAELVVQQLEDRARVEPAARWTRRTFPFDTLLMPLAPALRREVARQHASRIAASVGAAGPLYGPSSAEPRRLRIGYASADFRNHATAHLAAGLFERHDRSRFEVFAYSFGPDDGSQYRQRCVEAFDRFVDVNSDDPHEAARRIAADRVDILVDLMGYTRRSRPEIFAHRPAPIQVSYLGYPGSLQAPFVDYIVADRTVLPESDLEWFSESVVWLPASYQVNDDRQRADEAAPTRSGCGLPEDSFVYCCFNHPQKLERAIFAAWMRILAATPGAVLWLFSPDSPAEVNLRAAAAQAGVDPDRLVFAGVLPKPAHLARHRLADLFLDTHTCSAHTTASDALWAGLPVLTWPGDSFAGRVAASLLRAIGLPELVVDSLQEYERAAVSLARDRARLPAFRERLTANRLSMPLFRTETFTRNLERAFERMWMRPVAGQPPASFAVE
jgi:predicted O-linked N-acetylglucosamine transferase (SPINDLY family)